MTYAHENIAECYGYARDCGPLPALIMKYYPKGNITLQKFVFRDRMQSCEYNVLTDPGVDRSWILRGDLSTYIHSNSQWYTETCVRTCAVG